jgi:chromosome segregation protein
MFNRLRSLEMQGFKTFASRTEFVFAGDITAIVGPNGSGKSNIADAIRWVLGEQSYSLMRAKKTEDVIFSGSEQRSRANLAQATILFDNSDGWLPIDFSEVAITRRAYRDGQNEYLINGQRVRLRDVSELLAQSGLSERTYTMIGQGLVDAALSLKAEERRRLFEEAAGIGLHRSRREEALRRLDTTRRNLERVEDILAELQPRLRSLERQARRMMEYDQIKADLNVLLRDWYGYHWHIAQQDLRLSQESANRQESALNKVRQAQEVLDQRDAGLRQRLSQQREQVNSLRLRLSELHNQREAAGRERMVLDERIRALGLQAQSLEDQQVRLHDEQAIYQERLAAAQADLAHLEGELGEAARLLDEARQALQARQAERIRVERALQEARQVHGSLTGRQAFLQARLGDRKSQVERQQTQVREAQKNEADAQQELVQAGRRLETSQARLEKTAQARQAAEQALAAHQAQGADLEASRRALAEERSGLQANLARSKAQLDVLEQAERNLAGYAAGAKLLLQAARQGRLKGASGALSSRIQAAADYETAIAAALGEFLDAVILDGLADVDDSLSLLAQEGRAQGGRGFLLPLDAISSPGAPSLSALLSGRPGVIGLAAELVQAEPALAPVVRLLLGQVVVVEDRRAALALCAALRQANEPGARVVTRAGEVFYASGPVAAGRETRDEPSGGSLSRNRERKELSQHVSALTAQVETLDASLRGLQARQQLHAAEESSLKKSLQQALDAEKLALAARGNDELGVERARRSVQWNKEQAARLAKELLASQEEAAKMSAELGGLEAEIVTAREGMRQRSAALAALPLEELQSQVAHWQTRQAVIQQAVGDARKRLVEHQTALERSAQGLARIDIQQTALHTEQEASAAARSLAVEAEKENAEKIAIEGQAAEPAEAELAALERTLESLQNQETESRQQLSQAEHQYAQARILLARRQENLESLRRRVEDDFGLVAFRYEENVSGPTPLPLDGMVEQLPMLREIPPDLEENIKRQRTQLRRIGPVNPEAHAEYVQVKERYEFLTAQVADLHKAEGDLKQVIAELDDIMQREFQRTFDAVSREFRHIFTRLFNGGSARLLLTSPDDMTDTGIDIEARLPGRRAQELSLLSGGERSLTATALVFALLKVSPTPFCLLDEVDAMLDEANVGRFRDLLRELAQNTQFVVVTHNRNTVQAADVIYGVTMGSDSASQVISLKLDEVSKVIV